MGKIKPGHFLEHEDVMRLLRSEIERAGGQMPWAKMVGVDRSHVNKILQGAKPLGISIIKALNLRVVFAPNPEIDRCGAGHPKEERGSTPFDQSSQERAPEAPPRRPRRLAE